MPIIHRLFDVLAPSTCVGCGVEGTALCTACTSVKVTTYGSRCYMCGRLSAGSRTCLKCARLGGPRRLWISSTHEGLAEALVEQFKFGSHRTTAKSMANLMLQNAPPEALAGYVIVPVPTASGRVRERGFDHAKLLAQTIAKELNLPLCPALRHIGQTRQVGSSRAQRIKQALNSYRVASPHLVVGQKVLLIDDVVTTGATMQACAKLLRQSGATRVDGLAFAKRL